MDVVVVGGHGKIALRLLKLTKAHEQDAAEILANATAEKKP